jgi:peptide chain release factor 1
MIEKLREVKGRYEELTSMMGDPQIAGDVKQLKQISREHARLAGLVKLIDRHDRATGELAQSKRMLTEEEDEELRQMAREEIAALEAELVELWEKIQMELLPQDPLDGKDVYLELRAGTGGDEAALFVGDMLRMYVRYAVTRGWRLEIISEAEAERGGYKEVIARIEGEMVYSRLKYEAGTHRVQRVPATESQGRIHTSAVTVAVLPEADDVEVQIAAKDVREDTYRSSGAGGQHINKTDSAIRLTHLPTGIVVQCQSERSQHQNRAKAMQMLQAKLFEQQLEAQRASIEAERREQVGSGDRSERIRTYNYPQSRITDHRINFTTHRLSQVMEGDLDELLEPLLTYYRAEALKALR